MAYVGTPSFMGGDLNTLASILQGEAGGEGLQGLQAVADVLQNRANQNFGGYGSSLLDQALARNQFQGQSSNPGPQAQQVAAQLLNGQLPPDATGGALYYANPGASTAAWARNLNANNALQIGNHFFTNNTNGTPFAPNPYAGMADGPKGQEMYPSPSPQPSAVAASDPSDNGLGMTAQQGQDIASILNPNQNNFGTRLQAAFQQLGRQPNAPMPYWRGGGDARNSGDALLKALQSNGLNLTQLLTQQRLG